MFCIEFHDIWFYWIRSVLLGIKIYFISPCPSLLPGSVCEYEMCYEHSCVTLWHYRDNDLLNVCLSSVSYSLFSCWPSQLCGQASVEAVYSFCCCNEVNRNDPSDKMPGPCSDARTCSRPDVSSSQVQKLITIKSEVRSKVSTSPRVMTRLLPGLYSICNAEHVDRRIINRWTLICTPTLASTNIDNTPACRHAPRSPSVQGVALLTFQCVSRYGCYYDTGRDSSIVQCLLIGEIGT